MKINNFFFVSVLVVLLSGCMGVQNNNKNVDIDLSIVEDGTYKGSKMIGPVNVKLEVDVEDHFISDIRILRHLTLFGRPAEALVDNVIEKQSINVDAVSGATISSKAILASIKKALTSK